MINAQACSGVFYLIRRGGRYDGNSVPFGLVCFYECARFRVDEAGDLFGIQLSSHLVIGLFLNATHELGVDGHHAREPHIAEPKIGHGPHQFDKLAHGQIAAFELFADKGCG